MYPADDFDRYDIYAPFELAASLSSLSKRSKKDVGLLIEVSDIMDDLFWKQSFGEPKKIFLSKIKNSKLKKFSDMNYGPWDRLDGDRVFISGYKKKPLGAQFYPEGMSKSEFEKSKLKNKKGL